MERSVIMRKAETGIASQGRKLLRCSRTGTRVRRCGVRSRGQQKGKDGMRKVG